MLIISQLVIKSVLKLLILYVESGKFDFQVQLRLRTRKLSMFSISFGNSIKLLQERRFNVLVIAQLVIGIKKFSDIVVLEANVSKLFQLTSCIRQCRYLELLRSITHRIADFDNVDRKSSKLNSSRIVLTFAMFFSNSNIFN